MFNQQPSMQQQQQQPPQQQQQQQQPPQQQQQQQEAQAGTPGQPPTPTANKQPGFFARLFGRKQVPAADQTSGAQEPNAANQAGGPAVVEAPNAARCCPSKALPAEELEKLMQSPVAPSRYKFLQGAAAQQAGTWDPNAPAGQQQPPGITFTPQAGPLPETLLYGPFLRFGGSDPNLHAYYISVLVVAHQSKGLKPPSLKFRDINIPRSDTSIKAQHLEHYRGFNLWRFDLTILCGLPERVVEYMVLHEKDHMFAQQTRHCFFVPGVAQPWRWGFYNGNGFDKPGNESAMAGIQPMWRDVLYCHEQRPMHVMLAGGDQVYSDEVWNLPALMSWLQIPDRAQRLNHAFTQEMADQVEWYYFTNYVKHWSRPMFANAMATVPQVMVWNDHDIFDDWGSYPVELQFCPVFQGIFYMARKFYCLFQQHSTPEGIAEQNKVFGELGWHWIGCMGASTALVMLDTRMERSREVIVRPGSWVMVQQRLAALPSSIRHVIVVAPLPLAFPHLDIIQSTFEHMPGRGRLTSSVVAMKQKTAVSSLLLSSLGETEVLDDLEDRWSSRMHAQEKLAALHMLQDMALARGLRFTFLSGNVQVSGVGRFQSQHQAAIRSDHRFMPQIIAAAVGNKPAEVSVLKALTAAVKTKALDEQSKEMMLKIFDGNKPFKASRTWCLVEERAFVYGAPSSDGSITFQLRLERPNGIGQRPETVDIVVPVLQGVAGAFSINRLQPFALVGPPALEMPLMAQLQARQAGGGYQDGAQQWDGAGNPITSQGGVAAQQLLPHPSQYMGQQQQQQQQQQCPPTGQYVGQQLPPPPNQYFGQQQQLPLTQDMGRQQQLSPPGQYTTLQQQMPPPGQFGGQQQQWPPPGQNMSYQQQQQQQQQQQRWPPQGHYENQMLPPPPLDKYGNLLQQPPPPGQYASQQQQWPPAQQPQQQQQVPPGQYLTQQQQWPPPAERQQQQYNIGQSTSSSSNMAPQQFPGPGASPPSQGLDRSGYQLQHFPSPPPYGQQGAQQLPPDQGQYGRPAQAPYPGQGQLQPRQGSPYPGQQRQDPGGADAWYMRQSQGLDPRVQGVAGSTAGTFSFYPQQAMQDNVPAQQMYQQGQRQAVW